MKCDARTRADTGVADDGVALCVVERERDVPRGVVQVVHCRQTRVLVLNYLTEMTVRMTLTRVP